MGTTAIDDNLACLADRLSLPIYWRGWTGIGIPHLRVGSFGSGVDLHYRVEQMGADSDRITVAVYHVTSARVKKLGGDTCDR